jgi:hypothetical protein
LKYLSGTEPHQSVERCLQAEPLFVDRHQHINRHRDLRWFGSKIVNGLIKGINSLVQAAKAKARGYQSPRNLTAMVLLVAESSTSDRPRKEVSTHTQQRGTQIIVRR